MLNFKYHYSNLLYLWYYLGLCFFSWLFSTYCNSNSCFSFSVLEATWKSSKELFAIALKRYNDNNCAGSNAEKKPWPNIQNQYKDKANRLRATISAILEKLRIWQSTKKFFFTLAIFKSTIFHLYEFKSGRFLAFDWLVSINFGND